MRIAIASTGLGHISRGIETWADDLARALVARGSAAILCKGGGVCQTEYERVIPCMKRDAASTRRLLRWLPGRFFWRLGLANGYGVEQTSFAIGLIRVLRREKIDILHVQDPILALLIQRARQLKLVRTRTILGHGTEEPLNFIRKIDYLQHLAPWYLEEAKKCGVWKSMWTMIPNFIDMDRFRPDGENLRVELGIPPEALVVLCAAAIRRDHKRIDYLIDEVCRLRQIRPELPVCLLVAGGWERDTDELIAIGQRKLGDRVRFLVGFPRERMPDLYRSADIFTLCSLREMFGIVLLEALGTGVPCIVHRHPVLSWIVDANGCAIDMAAPGALAGALAELSADRPRLRLLASSARDYCGAHFGREKVVDQILAYYDAVMADDSRAVKQAAPEVSL